MLRFNVYNKSMKIIDSGLSAEQVKEIYEVKNPWRYANKGLLLHGRYRLSVVEGSDEK